MKLKIIIILVTLICGNHAHSRSPAVIYTIEDLKILVEQKHYREFLDHALDIRPSLRDQNWQQMLSQMARELTDEFISTQTWKLEEFNYLQDLLTHNSLKKDEVFLIKRKEFIISFLENCFSKEQVKNESSCEQLARMAWDTSPNKENLPEVGAEIGIILKKYHPETNLFPYIAQTLIGARSIAYCNIQEVQVAILNKFRNFMREERNPKEIISFTYDYFSPDCQQQIFTSLKNNFFSFPDAKIREEILNWLQALDQLSPQENKTFHTFYFLKGPIIGKVFNKSWNIIQKLGENYKDRKIVLDNILKIDPLPDDIFSSGDPKREVVLFDLIRTNFPEYIDQYSQTCIKYLKGSSYFPNGNPTIKCKDFFNQFTRSFGKNHPRFQQYKKLIQI